MDDKYSWLKTPRWKGHAMEVGPLARMLVGYASGQDEIKAAVDRGPRRPEAPPAVLFSTLGRTAARGIEARLTAKWGLEFYDSLIALIKAGDTRTFTRDRWEPSHLARPRPGASAPRRPPAAPWPTGSSSRTGRSRTTSWSCRRPGTPRPATRQGQRSAYEASLIGTPVHDPKQPLEIIRTIHSFDPCLACAVHLYEDGAEVAHHELFVK